MSRQQLHWSGIEMLSKCGEQFRRRYIEREVVPPGIALHVGTATHGSVRRNMRSKIDTGTLLDVDACEAAAADELNASWQQNGVTLLDEERSKGEKTARGEAVDKAVRLARLHRQKLAPLLQPTHVERAWTLDLTGTNYALAGQIDLQEAATIRDTKTAAKSPSSSAAETSDQLTMYALATTVLDGPGVRQVALDTLVDLKTGPKVVTLESVRTPDDYAPLLRRVQTAIVATERGVFVPARQSDWWCSERWCGYWRNCKYVRRPVSVALTVNGKEPE